MPQEMSTVDLTEHVVTGSESHQARTIQGKQQLSGEVLLGVLAV